MFTVGAAVNFMVVVTANLKLLLSMNMYYYDKKTKRLITDRVKIKRATCLHGSSWIYFLCCL